MRSTAIATFAIVLAVASTTRADDLPIVAGVDDQPILAQARRLAEALEGLGRPLNESERGRLERAAESELGTASRLVQELFDPHCLVGVSINPESRVKVRQGPAEPVLAQQGWRTFLVKVHNEAGVTAPLRVSSPNAAPVYTRSSGRPDPPQSIPPGSIPDRWLEVVMADDRPLNPTLSGLPLEYRIIQIYSRDAGPREAKLSFDVGQGTQDLGFRSDADILFRAEAGSEVTLDLRDVDGSETTASLLIHDAQGRVYPSPGRRLAPDFFFHPQIYRRAGESVILPPGDYRFEVTRGPEYRTIHQDVHIDDAPSQSLTFKLERWADLAAMGWYSGDHHVHAAGCAHYESPTEGVGPEDMMRHILGEDLDVGCVLSWGPCWYAQKQYFDGEVHELSTADHLMRYDVEVSGFPSSHAGHLCLLRLAEDDYPGSESIEDWPSWDLPVLRWGKSQGAVVGFSHSGWGLQTDSKDLPNFEIPPYDGIGANEYIVDVVHGDVDFISAVDTPAPFELNIWYHTLNCGFRCRISGETDFPCIYGERVGLGRSYVKVDGPIDYDRWVDGIRGGRSYVSDGRAHLVDYAVDDVRVGEAGSERTLDAPGTVHVTARVAALLEAEPSDRTRSIQDRPLDQQPYWDVERARVGDSRTVPVEVVVNGLAVDRREVEADGTFRDVAFDVPIERSSWVALRIYPSAHTNPIFVLVDGAPIRASKRSAEWCLDGVDQCWSQKVGNIRSEERSEAEAAFEVARNAYRRIIDECPED